VRKELRWKLILILAVSAVAAFFVFPVEEKVKLGLDLSGGIHLVLQVKTDDAVKAVLDLRSNALSEQFSSRGLRLQRIDRDVEGGALVVIGPDPVSKAEFRQIIEQFLPSWEITEPGDDLRAAMSKPENDAIRDTAVTDTLERIRDRVDEYGVAEPNVQRQGLGSDRILVQLPGVDNPERVKDLLSKPAFLEFKLVSYPPEVQEWQGTSDPRAIQDLFGGALPPDTAIFPQELAGAGPEGPTIAYWPLKLTSHISGSDLVQARRGQAC
jgi:preprotein translocase subunit SecD